MIFELKLRKVGNSVGIALPRAVLDHLGLGSTGSVFMTETTEAFATGKCPAGYYLRWLYANTCE